MAGATSGRPRHHVGPDPRHYSAYLALVCGADAQFPQAADALQALLGITGGFPEMLADPAWRIVPRNALTNSIR
ncbi:MAG: hypothetical protein NTY19_18280 [Planctomycetota bacterium]|nr:hypothetical protein [Planctomycetota bacterium]